MNYNTRKYKETYFGKNNVISFPVNFPGHNFVRFSYHIGDKLVDRIKKITKYLEPFINIYNYFKLYYLYYNGNIISIQEHISPATLSGLVQSTNIISDIKSLKKIYSFIGTFSIWYDTCANISKYIYTRENCKIEIKNDLILVQFNNSRKLENCTLSITNKKKMTLVNGNVKLHGRYNNKRYVINLPVENGQNVFRFIES